MVYPLTPNLGLPLVPDGDQAWGPAMRGAMETLDGLSGATLGRRHVVATTATLATDATDHLDLEFAETCDLIAITVDYPCWVTIYDSDAARTADSTRDLSVDPRPGKGIMGEIVPYAGNLTIYWSPSPLFNNNDTTLGKTAYIAVTNMHGSSAAITVDFTILPQEYVNGSGPQGSTGVTGPTGATGATGAAGTNGTNGTNGADGVDGRLSRTSVTWTTGTLATNATETQDNALAKTARLYKITTSQQAWVRLYSTSSARTADASRISTVDPTIDSGVEMEVTTATGALVVPLKEVTFSNMDGTVSNMSYLSVKNLGTSGTVTVTITYQNQED